MMSTNATADRTAEAPSGRADLLKRAEDAIGMYAVAAGLPADYTDRIMAGLADADAAKIERVMAAATIDNARHLRKVNAEPAMTAPACPVDRTETCPIDGSTCPRCGYSVA